MAEPIIPPSTPVPTQPSAPSVATPLEGRTTIDDKVHIEVDVLVYRAVSKLAEAIASRVATKLGEERPQCVVLVDNTAKAALNLAVTFKTQSVLLQRSFETIHSAAQDALGDLQNRQEVLQKQQEVLQKQQDALNRVKDALRTLQKEPAGLTDIEQFKAALLSGIEVAPAIGAVTGIATAAVNVLSLFRQDRSYIGREVRVHPLGLITELARSFAKLKVDFHCPGVFALRVADSGDPTQPNFLRQILLIAAERDRAYAGCHELAIAVQQLKDDPRLPHARSVLDRLQQQFESSDSILQHMQKFLTHSDDKTSLVPIDLLALAAELEELLARNSVHLLHTEVLAAGGEYRLTHSRLKGDRLLCTAGAIACFALLSSDGRIVDAGTLSHREPKEKQRSRLMRFWLGDPNVGMGT